MANLGCTCGRRMSSTNLPSDNIIYVFPKKGVRETLELNPDISLLDYERDYNRELEYWYCTECRRVHVVDNVPCGKVLTVYESDRDSETYSPSELPLASEPDFFYVFSEKELYDEEECDNPANLAEWIERQGIMHYYCISSDKNTVYKRELGGKYRKVYSKEKSR